MNFKIKTTAFRGLCLKIALFISKNADFQFEIQYFLDFVTHKDP